MHSHYQYFTAKNEILFHKLFANLIGIQFHCYVLRLKTEIIGCSICLYKGWQKDIQNHVITKTYITKFYIFNLMEAFIELSTYLLAFFNVYMSLAEMKIGLIWSKMDVCQVLPQCCRKLTYQALSKIL